MIATPRLLCQPNSSCFSAASKPLIRAEATFCGRELLPKMIASCRSVRYSEASRRLLRQLTAPLQLVALSRFRVSGPGC
jgi:hypothetical protein